jgi:hypothetical protein
VQIRDGNNNLVAGSTAPVTAAIFAGTGTLSGTTTVNAVGGVATFTDLTITGTGAHSIRFTSAGLTGVTSANFTVAGQATRLVITTQPTGAQTGTQLLTQPVVEVRDANNALVSASSAPVTVAIASGSGSLSGTVTVNAVNGVASFNNLVITGTGDHTLQFTSTGLTSATSSTINITAQQSPYLSITFDNYTSTAELRNDCTTFNCVEQDDINSVDLDATMVPPGGTKSMRYHYLHGGNGCNSITIRRSIKFPTVQQEAWAEFRIRFSTNFSTANSSCAPNDHKLIFGDTRADQSGRWAFYVGADSPPTHTIMVQRPSPDPRGGFYPNRRNAPFAETLWQSGTWHTVRLHLKHSTTATSADGAFEVWLDGLLIHREINFNTDDARGGTDRLMGFSFAHNKDDGPPGVDMYLWWGPITIYTVNPGW